MGSTIPSFESLGVLLAFSAGAYGDFSTIPIFAIVTSISFAVLFLFFPETPAFLMRQKKLSVCHTKSTCFDHPLHSTVKYSLQKTEKSIRFYRNIREKDLKSGLVQLEMGRLSRAMGMMEAKKIDARRMKWSDLTTRPGSKAMIIGIILVVLNQFSGIFALLSYAATIFHAAGFHGAMSPNMSAIIVQSIQLIATCAVTPLIIDRAGRRVRMLTMCTLQSD